MIWATRRRRGSRTHGERAGEEGDDNDIQRRTLYLQPRNFSSDRFPLVYHMVQKRIQPRPSPRTAYVQEFVVLGRMRLNSGVGGSVYMYSEAK